MRKFGLIGYPLEHSFSKKYFTDKFEREGLSDCLYENFPLEKIDLIKEMLENEPELCGFNVTIPYKSSVMRFLSKISQDAAEIGAVNVVKIKRKYDGLELHGFNSDITGIRDSLEPYVTKKIKKVMVLGTGGSSRAVSYVLRAMGINVILVSRSSKQGTVKYEDLTGKMFDETGIIINTTPLGMYPDVNSMPGLDYNMLNSNHILFDLVYNPERTMFLKMGEERGCKVIGGLKMLYSQAEKAWEIWNDDNL